MDIIRHLIAEIIPEDELMRNYYSRTINHCEKLGLDPPRIFMGHTVVLNKLRQFQTSDMSSFNYWGFWLE